MEFYGSNVEVYGDSAIFVNRVLRSYLSDKQKVSFLPILEKMQKSATIAQPPTAAQAFLRLDLTEFERFCLFFLLVLETNLDLRASYEKIVKHDFTSLQMLYRACVGEQCLDYSLSDAGKGIFDLQNNVLTLTPFFAQYLMQDTCAGAQTVPPPVPLFVYQEQAQSVMDMLAQNTQLLVHLYGEKSVGKSQFVRYIACHTRKKLLTLDFSTLRFSTPEMLWQRLHQAAVFAQLEQGIVYLSDIALDLTEKERFLLSQALEMLQPYTVFVSSVDKDAVENRTHAQFVKVQLANLTADEKISVWQAYQTQYQAELDATAMGNKYVFNVGEIHNTFASARVLSQGVLCEQDLVRATKMRDSQLIGADLITTSFTFDDLVVDAPVKRQLDHIIHQMQYKNVLYSTWGFGDKIPYGRGISALFYGPPGTGKTMTASVIANALQLDLYRIDLSKLVSKYIGETEKNISSLFDKAKNMNVVLFFDEADALFAKRAEVKDSHDKNANAETAHLLQKLEEYEGISILATNLYDQLDDAFRRRIKFMVPFVLPSEAVRLQLWEKILPPADCIDEVDVGFFAKNFELSGSQIKEIVLNAAFIAVAEGEKLANKHVKEAVTLNYQKYGKRLAGEDFLYLA